VSATARQTITLAQGRVATTFVDITNNDQSNERTVTITVDASFLNGFPGAATLAFPGLADLTLSMSSTNINTLQDPGNGTSTLTASTTAGSPGGTLLGAFLDEDGSTGVLVKEDVGIANQFFDLNQEVTVVLAPGAIFSFELTSTHQPTGEPFEPIPEPGTIAMALTALPLMGLGYYVRRRSQA
jgi:hypothetical protein